MNEVKQIMFLISSPNLTMVLLAVGLVALYNVCSAAQNVFRQNPNPAQCVKSQSQTLPRVTEQAKI